jgi:protein disulfide-isomerase A1
VVSTLDKNSLAAFKSIDDAVFIGYYGSGDAELKSSFTTLASRNHHSFTFGTSSSAALAKTDSVALGCIVCHRTAREPETLCGQSRLDVLQEFVDKSTTPLIGQMTRRNELKYLLVCPPAAKTDQRTNLYRPGNR